MNGERACNARNRFEQFRTASLKTQTSSIQFGSVPETELIGPVLFCEPNWLELVRFFVQHLLSVPVTAMKTFRNLKAHFRSTVTSMEQCCVICCGSQFFPFEAAFSGCAIKKSSLLFANLGSGVYFSGSGKRNILSWFLVTLAWSVELVFLLCSRPSSGVDLVENKISCLMPSCNRISV